MLELDGSFGESGGQILRTALGLSAYTKTPFRLINIRQKRKNPGLSEQHVQAIKAVQQVCNAKVSGCSLESSEITFVPEGLSKSRNISVTIGTAGSVGLVLQALMIPTLSDNFSISIFGGGTYGQWAPPVDHIKYVVLPLLERFGYNAQITIEKEGFYPRGGAFVKVQTQKSSLEPIILKKKISSGEFKCISLASESLREKKVVERQSEGIQNIVSEKINLQERYVRTLSIGSAVQIVYEGKESIIGSNSLGAVKKSAEKVGEEAATLLLAAKEYAVDKFTADQLIPFMAIAGGGELLVEEVSEHARTNAWVVEQFLPVKFEFKEHSIRCSRR